MLNLCVLDSFQGTKIEFSSRSNLNLGHYSVPYEIVDYFIVSLNFIALDRSENGDS